MLARASVEVLKWARGVGKTSYRGWRWRRIALSMPRSKNSITGRTYGQLLTSIIPETVAFLEGMGYHQDKHFVIGHEPPKAWPKPIRRPSAWKNTMTWFTGAYWQFLSQDREGMSRGNNLDSAEVDEGLTLNPERFRKEVLTAVRTEPMPFWEDTTLHRSISIMSSQSIGSQGQWMDDYRAYFTEDGAEYDQLLRQIADLGWQFCDPDLDTGERLRIWEEIEALKRKVVWYKAQRPPGHPLHGVFYSEADALENIEVLGLQYFLDSRRNLTETEFRIELLNQRVPRIENGFYATFNIERHGYDAWDYSAIDNEDKFTRFSEEPYLYQSDILRDKPLDIACDYGVNLNCVVTRQMVQTGETTEDRRVNCFFRKSPYLITDVIQDWCTYHRRHTEKTVNYWYDHTAIDRTKNVVYRDEVIKVLRKNGWNVNEMYIGQAAPHDVRYNLSAKTFTGHGYPEQRFNRKTCKYLIVAIEQTGVKVSGRGGFEKDKSTERNKNFPQEEAPHLTDADDVITTGRYLRAMSGMGTTTVMPDIKSWK